MSPPLEARSVGGVLIGRAGISYFVQAPYAGVSAFINTPAAEAERNACMLSVGVLVPLSYGRLGRSWRHAENLKGLAKCEILPSSLSLFRECATNAGCFDRGSGNSQQTQKTMRR